jgi:hypothetical protein
MTSLLLPGGDYLDQVRAVIRAHGWAIQAMHEPPWAALRCSYPAFLSTTPRRC